MKIKNGSLFIISDGEYSSYTVQSLFRANRDIDAEELTKEYLELYPEQKEPYSASFKKFINWLVNVKRAMDEVDYSEWHLGNYDEFEPVVTKDRGHHMPAF